MFLNAQVIQAARDRARRVSLYCWLASSGLTPLLLKLMRSWTGRLFYVCNRPDGKPPQGRCDHFEWSGKREVRGQVNLPAPSRKRKEHRTEHV